MVKGLKDGNGPKRPLSAYMAWQNSVRERVTKTMPVGYSFGELARKFSEMWKNMEDDKKAPFEKKAKKDGEKYSKLMSAYKLTTEYKTFQKLKAQSEVDGVKKSKFKKDENAPTRPQSGYFLFMGDKREGLVAGGLAHKDAIKKMGEMWSAMSDKQKKPYQKKAADAKAKYEKELAKYQKTAAYRQYQAEKEEWEANKKGDLKKAKVKQEKVAEKVSGKKKTPTKSKKTTPKKSSGKKKAVSKGKKVSAKKKAKKATGKPKAPKSAAKKKKSSGKKAKAKKGSGKKGKKGKKN